MNNLRKTNNMPCTTDGTNYRFHLVLFVDGQELKELWLPRSVDGDFFFSDEPQYRFLCISARNGEWNASCRGNAFFVDVPLSQQCDIPLKGDELLTIEKGERNYTLLVEEASMERMRFHSYAVGYRVRLTIGSHLENDIVFRNPYISEIHAVLTYEDGIWFVQSQSGKNGLYRNGRRIQEAQLDFGDTLYLLGLRIVVGPGLVSIRCGWGSLTVNPEKMQDTLMLHAGSGNYGNQDSFLDSEIFFNRKPRKRVALPQTTITVEGPPMSMNQANMPMMLRMGSSMITGGAAALTGNYMTLLTGVLLPVLSNKFTEEQKKEYEHLRVTRYTEYLEQKRQEILRTCVEEQNALNQKYPEFRRVLAQGKEHLWERRPVDSDFLHVRLGSGTQPMSAKLNYPQRRFELESDELEEKMYCLVETPYILRDVPVVLPVTEYTVLGVQGEQSLVRDYLLKMISQIAFYHSYDELKMVFLMDEGALDAMDPIRFLPHAWDNYKATRLLAVTEADAYEVGEYLKNQLVEDGGEKLTLSKRLKRKPYYLIIALNRKLLDHHEVFKTLLQSDENMGASVIAAFDDLPKETQAILTLNENHSSVYTTLQADGGEDICFTPDYCKQTDIQQAMRLVSNTNLKLEDQTQAMPKMVTFLEMFGAGKVEHLNSLKRWRENNPVKSLAVPVGVGADGSLFTLDLHEKRQGPHGLVAGMTGSGKSEFIITYILSLAINYHPDEVAFVLIDYKGGGLAGAFENPQTGVRLPHLVGTITNLDGASIQRSLMSIESELLRRQRKFNEVKSVVNEGTMDIYTYQKLYRAGVVKEPMPHLFIISDEFAELKQQQPEFMDKLISAARIGRSLGVHLILATQKPSGVVNDQIRSNTKFRVCLRVQERADSMDMLKRPEAAELTDTGRFYLQVGYNEYFAMGQSAWCGAAYEPQDTVPVHRDDEVLFLDITGQTIAKAKPKVKKTTTGMKQIVAVVNYLSELAKSQGIPYRQLWKPKLPERLDLEQLNKNNSNSPHSPFTMFLGMLDDPENQNQYPATADFCNGQNMLIVGESGSGKTVMLQSILTHLSKKLTSLDLNYYILDYSSRMMKIFKNFPHCGAVLYEEDTNSLDVFFEIINAIVTERKALYTELEVDSFESARAARPLPLVLVIIDNFPALSASKAGEAHAYKMQSYLKNCVNYGIKFIITCSHLNEISGRIRQELRDCICLHMKDKYDYGDALGCKVSLLPPDIPGRGLLKYMERPLEFQSAMICACGDENARMSYIKSLLCEIQQGNISENEARQMPVYSESAEYVDFFRQFRRGRIPLGYFRQNGKPVALPLKQFSILSLYFGNPDGTIPILTNLLYAAQKEKMELWIIKRRNNSVFDAHREYGIDPGRLANADILPCTIDNLRLLQKGLTAIMAQQRSCLEACYSDGNIDPNQDDAYAQIFQTFHDQTTPIFLVIESVADFCMTLNSLLIMGFRELFLRIAQRNIYIIGCFEPELPPESTKNSLFPVFSRHDILLFGGQFGKQTLCHVSDEVKKILRVPFNSGIMKYRDQYYPLLMPCGEIVEKEEDADMQNIF